MDIDTDISLEDKKKYNVYVIIGHTGLVGSAIYRRLKKLGYRNVIGFSRSKSNLDVCVQDDLSKMFQEAENTHKNMCVDIDHGWPSQHHHLYDIVYDNNFTSPTKIYKHKIIVYMCAAYCGGLYANIENNLEFLHENVKIVSSFFGYIQKNFSTYDFTKYRIIFFGSSCVYPKNAPQPFQEKSIATGSLETTNEGYALVKLLGLRWGHMLLKEQFVNIITVTPPNIYGPADNFTPEGHVVAALIDRTQKAIDAKTDLVVYGKRDTRREFMHSSELADKVITLSNSPVLPKIVLDYGHINIGTNMDYSIEELVNVITHKMGYVGNIIYDVSKASGVPAKLMNSQHYYDIFDEDPAEDVHLSLEDGIENTVNYYRVMKEMQLI